MKRVIFSGQGDIELRLEPDFGEAESDGQGEVRVSIEGIAFDVNGNPAAAEIYGWYSPSEAREIAKYLNEMADRAEAGAQ
ncbi:hypothetical protein [Deinococcus sp. PEB2-63]